MTAQLFKVEYRITPGKVIKNMRGKDDFLPDHPISKTPRGDWMHCYHEEKNQAIKEIICALILQMADEATITGNDLIEFIELFMSKSKNEEDPNDS